MDPQGPLGMVSTLLLLLHRVRALLLCPASPNSFTLLPLNLPPEHRFHRRLQSRSSHPVGRNHSQAPTQALPVLLLNGGLLHPSIQIASPLALELAHCTPSQEVLWVEVLWGGMGVLLLPPLDLWLPRGRLCPAAPQRAPLLWVVPHLWWAALLGRTGGKGTVV